jgi:hypothetical protein
MERDRTIRRPDDERGAALIMSLFFMIVTVGIVFTGVLIEKANRDKTRTNFRLNSQANQFARAGLTEAVSWYRRQTSQPVAGFEPVVDMQSDPPIIDSDEPDLGIVREFRIEGKIWGRYEVWKEWADDPVEERRAWRARMQCQDVSPQRHTGSGGTSWRLRSLGYVFEREDREVRFDEAPNRVVAVEILETEIVRRRLAPPGQSALTVGDGNSAHVNTYGRIEGGTDGSGIYYPAGSGRPTTGPNNQRRVTGNPALSQAPGPIDLSPEAVFGVSYSELKASADHVVTDRRDIPVPIGDMATVVIESASVTFDRDTPLLGSGIVYVKGNCSIIAGSNSRFSGLLYVEGNLIVRAPSEIEGAAIVTGNFNIQGSGDYATIRYSDEVLNALRQSIGQYRFLGPFRPVHGGF